MVCYPPSESGEQNTQIFWFEFRILLFDRRVFIVVKSPDKIKKWETKVDSLYLDHFNFKWLGNKYTDLEQKRYFNPWILEIKRKLIKNQFKNNS